MCSGRWGILFVGLWLAGQACGEAPCIYSRPSQTLRRLAFSLIGDKYQLRVAMYPNLILSLHTMNVPNLLSKSGRKMATE
jgi:hypothetical protein